MNTEVPDESESNATPTSKKGWRAHCINHDWEGAFQTSYDEAKKDFDAHDALYPEVPCSGGAFEADS